MGALHLRYPSYNAVTLCDSLQEIQPNAVVTTALEDDALSGLEWQATPEIALPLALVPWLEQRTMPLHCLLEPSPDPDALADFQRFAQEYPQVKQKLQQVDSHLRLLQALLAESLTLERITNEVLPLLRNYFQAQQEELEEGPATDWWVARASTMVQKLTQIDAEHIALLAPIDHIAALEYALDNDGTIAYGYPANPEPSEQARTRAILDFAFRGDAPEPANLLAQLRQLAEDTSQSNAVQHEALFHQVSILLSHSHLAEASELLENLAKQPLAAPYFLPSYVLARLGQIRDLRHDRQGALRAYKTVLALDWAAPDAVSSAQEGLAQPFGEEKDEPT